MSNEKQSWQAVKKSDIGVETWVGIDIRGTREIGKQSGMPNSLRITPGRKALQGKDIRLKNLEAVRG